MLRLKAVEIRIGKFALICALSLLAASWAPAEDWTAGGKTYRGVKVLAHTSLTVTILCQDGGATLKLADLPPALQQKYGFDPAAAAVEQAKEDAEKAKADAVAAQAAADLKAKQEAQAAADNAARDAAGQTVVVAAKDLAEDQKQLEISSAKAKADYDSIEKVAVTGQVFVVTRERETIPIGSTHVRLYSYDQAHAAMELLSAKGGAEQKKMDPALTQEKAKCVAVYAAGAASKAADRAAATKKWDDVSKEYVQMLNKYYSYSSQPYYAENMPPALADSLTDAGGKFSMKIPKAGSWVLVAQGQRAAGGEKENCLWIAKVSTEAITRNQVVLNNDNLTGEDSLMTCPSDSDLFSLVQQKIDDIRQK